MLSQATENKGISPNSDVGKMIFAALLLDAASKIDQHQIPQRDVRTFLSSLLGEEGAFEDECEDEYDDLSDLQVLPSQQKVCNPLLSGGDATADKPNFSISATIKREVVHGRYFNYMLTWLMIRVAEKDGTISTFPLFLNRSIFTNESAKNEGPLGEYSFEVDGVIHEDTIMGLHGPLDFVWGDIRFTYKHMNYTHRILIKI